MWNYLVRFQNRKGFTLVEFLLYTTLSSILLITVFSLLNYSNRALDSSDTMDEILLQGRYGLEYIKSEILSADKIISSSKIKDLDLKYRTNIGFVIMKEKDGLYNYITYYQRNDELVRLAGEWTSKNYPSQTIFKGFNQLSTNLISLQNTTIDKENNVLYLHLDMGTENKLMMEFKSTSYLRCIVDFN